MRPDHPSRAAGRSDAPGDPDDPDHREGRDGLDGRDRRGATRAPGRDRVVDGPVLDPVLERPVLTTALGRRPGQPPDPTEHVVDALAGEEDVVSHVLDPSIRLATAQVDGLVRMVDPPAVVCFAVGRGSAVRVRSDDRSPAARLDLDALVAALRDAGVAVAPPRAPGGVHEDIGELLLRHVSRMPALAGRPVGLVRVPPGEVGGLDPVVLGRVGLAVVTAVVAMVVDRGDHGVTA